MKVNITRRNNTPGYVDIHKDRDAPNRLFISTPNMLTLTEQETQQLIEALTTEANNIWNKENN